ncbi:nucleoside monophosphate kinase [bacterium]|nr:nucleoside monophosphate kinase [bacterium]
MRLALFGPPGAGKGTQSTFLRDTFGLRAISTGNIIRKAIREGHELGPTLDAHIKDGGLVPDEIVQDLAKSSIVRHNFDQFVLDGFPRTLSQAKWLNDFLEAYKVPLQMVIFLAVPDEVVIERLSQRRIHKLTCEPYHLLYHPPPADVDPSLIIQRKDDRPEAIRFRLETYKKVTEPVERFYEDKGLLTKISGLGSNTEIQKRILENLNPSLEYQIA